MTNNQCYEALWLLVWKQPDGSGPSYRGITQFHPEVNLSVPLSPVDVGREELHGHCVISTDFMPLSKLFKLKVQSPHQRSYQPRNICSIFRQMEENTSGR